MTRDGSARRATPRKELEPKNVVVTPRLAADKARPHVLGLLRDTAGRAVKHLVDAAADFVLRAASQATSLTNARCDAEDGPSRRSLARVLEDLGLRGLEEAVNNELWEQLRRWLPRRPTLGIDWVLNPYHGKHHKSEKELKRCAAKDGTTWFHAYATVYVVLRNRRYTLLVRYVRSKETPTETLEALLEALQVRGVRPRLVLADKAFCTVKAVKLLKERGLAFILPLPLKGRRAKALQRGRGSHMAAYRLGGKDGVSVRVAVVVKRNAEKYHGRKPGNQYFPYVVYGLTAAPKRVDRLYRQRGGIESSYRLMNEARPRTSSRNPAIRLLYVAVAFILQNAWVTLAWTVSAPQRGRGGRWRPPGFFAFRRFLRLVESWLEEEYGREVIIRGLNPRRRAA